MNLSLQYFINFSSANSQQNRGMIWHISGVIEDEGQLIDRILN